MISILKTPLIRTEMRVPKHETYSHGTGQWGSVQKGNVPVWFLQEREELQASSCNTFHDVSPPELGQVGDLGLGEEK